jgi:membrane protein DedA with SNARE-associated domain
MFSRIIYAEFDLAVIIPLALLGAIIGTISNYFYSRRWKKHNTDLINSGFPPDLADSIARLLADDRTEEAEAIIKHHNSKGSTQ